MRILSIDIETSPNIVYKWDLFDKTPTPISMIEQPSRMMCFAAKWVDESGEPEFHSQFGENQRMMVNAAWRLIEEADVLLHYNGQSFDERKLNREFVVEGFNPPAPFLRVDLYRAVKAKFAFPSGKLDYVCRELELGQKVKHEGIDLWRKCMAGDPDAWARMESYNKQDVVLNEDLFHQIRAWIPGLPSYGAESGEDVCPACGSHNLIKQGHAFTKTGRYQRYVCGDCASWSRGSRRDQSTKIVQVAA